MPFQPVPSCYLAVIEGTADAQKVNNTMYFQRSGAASFAEASELATDLVSWYVDNVLPNLSETYIFHGVRVTDLESEAGVQAFWPALEATGGQAQEQAPSNVAACITFRTELRGRSFRGRNYVPSIPNSDIATNTLQGAIIAALINAYDNDTVNAAVNPLVWVVVSRVSGGTARAAGIATPITQVTITTPTVSSQRRRLPGRGQ